MDVVRDSRIARRKVLGRSNYLAGIDNSTPETIHVKQLDLKTFPLASAANYHAVEAMVIAVRKSVAYDNAVDRRPYEFPRICIDVEALVAVITSRRIKLAAAPDIKGASAALCDLVKKHCHF